MEKPPRVEEGSGNVFVDLGLMGDDTPPFEPDPAQPSLFEGFDGGNSGGGGATSDFSDGVDQ